MSETTERLDAIAARLDAATPGPWKADTGVRGDCVVWGPNGRFLMNMQAEPHWIEYPGEKRMVSFDVDKRDAEFIADARTDVAYLLTLARKQAATLDAVRDLHKPVKKWEPYEGAGYSFNTREEALRAGGEEDLNSVAIEAGPQFFEICAECGRVESEQLAETGEDWGYRESIWPCPTIVTIGEQP